MYDSVISSNGKYEFTSPNWDIIRPLKCSITISIRSPAALAVQHASKTTFLVYFCLVVQSHIDRRLYLSATKDSTITFLAIRSKHRTE